MARLKVEEGIVTLSHCGQRFGSYKIFKKLTHELNLRLFIHHDGRHHGVKKFLLNTSIKTGFSLYPFTLDLRKPTVTVGALISETSRSQRSTWWVKKF